MSLHSSLHPDEIKEAIEGVIDFLQDRAHKTLESDPNGDDALKAAHQFLVVTELVHFYGSALIAIDDIEDEELPN